MIGMLRHLGLRASSVTSSRPLACGGTNRQAFSAIATKQAGLAAAWLHPKRLPHLLHANIRQNKVDVLLLEPLHSLLRAARGRNCKATTAGSHKGHTAIQQYAASSPKRASCGVELKHELWHSPTFILARPQQLLHARKRLWRVY